MLENARFLLEEWAFSSIFDVGEAMCLADKMSALQIILRSFLRSSHTNHIR